MSLLPLPGIKPTLYWIHAKLIIPLELVIFTCKIKQVESFFKRGEGTDNKIQPFTTVACSIFFVNRHALTNCSKEDDLLA